MGQHDFEIHKDRLLDEEVWLATTSHGLRLRVVPTERFQEAAAMVSFRYGSTDLGFVEGGGAHRSPEGVAHYLEHKLFEDEELKVFDRFARRGARVNAMTGFTRTSYHFTATDQVLENLDDLLHLVSRAHVTPENVDKERGIIAQEIRMYEDSADYRLFFDFLGGLFGSHPVRHPVGGTVASIADITADELLACYHAFYRTGNAAMAVAGPVDPHAILQAAEGCKLASGKAPESVWEEDLGPVLRSWFERELQVPRSKVMLGFKDRDVVGDPEARLRRHLVTEILLDRLFSPSSEIREDLRRRGIVDDSLSFGYLSDFSFGFSSVSCESDDPRAAAEALRRTMLRPVELDEDYVDRVRRKMLGRYVRSFGSVRNLAFGQAQEALDDITPFRMLERFSSVTAADVVARQREHCREDSCAVAVAVAGQQRPGNGSAIPAAQRS